MKKLVFTAFALIVFISCSVQKHELQHEPTEMTVMTFNIRLDHAGDKENNWKFRKERVVKSIQFYEADIAGMQVHIPEHTHPLIPVELSLQEQQ